MAGTQAVVIGGGFIGVEVASSLAARGLTVTVVEVAGALWAGALGEPLSDWARERLSAAGVDVRLERHLRVRHGRWRATGRGAACRPTWWWPVSA